MTFVSDFADQAVMLPLSAVVLLALVVIGWWRGAAAWLGAVGLTFLTVGLLKAAFVVMTAHFGSDYQISPSGHVAAAAVVYGGLVILLLQGVLPRVVLALLVAAVVVGMGVIRVDLGAHTPMEAAAGAVVGLAGLIAFALTAGPRPQLAALPLSLASGVTALVLHGWHLGAEQAIRSASLGW
jgi:membrane-associated phospholipid phosphatase